MSLSHILLVTLFIGLTNTASIKPRNTRLCPDGKTSPLLEGEFNIFPCIYDCPSGFTCESQDSPEGGICCPDLDLLYELYSDDKQPERSEDALNIPNVPNLPVVFMDGSKEPIRNEVRRAPIATTLVPTSLNFTIVTLSATRSLSTTQSPAEFSLITQPKKIVGLNCRRKQLQHKCGGLNGPSSTQYVIRWYKQAGACHSYIYGYCPGTRIDLDITLRTKDDCEALCLSADEFQQSDLLKFLVASSDGKDDFSIRSHAAPLLKSVETIELSQSKKSKLRPDVVSFQSSHDSSIDFQVTTTLAPRKRCSRLPYRSMCPENNMPSQFTIRWYRNQSGNCTAYGFGFCHGETVFDNETLKSKEECIRYCPGLSASSNERIDFATRLIRK